MNKARRDRIGKIAAKLDEARSEIEAIRDEEQEAYDNMPQSFQDGERGETMTAAIEAMGTAFEYVDSAIDQLSEATP